MGGRVAELRMGRGAQIPNCWEAPGWGSGRPWWEEVWDREPPPSSLSPSMPTSAVPAGWEQGLPEAGG